MSFPVPALWCEAPAFCGLRLLAAGAAPAPPARPGRRACRPDDDVSAQAGPSSSCWQLGQLSSSSFLDGSPAQRFFCSFECSWHTSPCSTHGRWRGRRLIYVHTYIYACIQCLSLSPQRQQFGHRLKKTRGAELCGRPLAQMQRPNQGLGQRPTGV